ncbi:hypothetical protein BDV40DRAFT_76734 [Aspergillus tamarii]|uniref:Uncharacterized protein n=1 Tax=Aspergillus tamarii TaxID=41984 RepID=A0A5N6UD21_ASPTM|nr:hypothetical protein BDV40DRAFT_76734 [Aspergillus tamarii]
MKALNVRYLGSVAAEKEFFYCSAELRSLLDICQALRKEALEKDYILHLAHNKLLDDWVQHLSNYLADDDLLLLSLVTWHFDSSIDFLSPISTPSQGLLQFFTQDSLDHKVLKILRQQYCGRVGKQIKKEMFEERFWALLCQIHVSKYMDFHIMLTRRSTCSHHS